MTTRDRRTFTIIYAIACGSAAYGVRAMWGWDAWLVCLWPLMLGSAWFGRLLR